MNPILTSVMALFFLFETDAEMEARLRDEGYSRAEIEKLIQLAKNKPAEPETQPEPTTEDEGPVAPDQEALTAKLVEIGLSLDECPTHVKALLKLDAAGQEAYLKKLENQLRDKKWIDKQLEPLLQRFEDTLWSGKELEERVELERNFWLKNLEALRTKNGEVNSDQLAKLRKKFIRDLVDAYLKEVGIKDLDDEQRIEFYDAAPTFVDSKFDIREKKIRQILKEMEAAKVAERREAMVSIRDKTLSDLKVYWADKRTEPSARKTRLELVQRIFEDLASCDSKEKFETVLSSSMKTLTENGISAVEKGIIKGQLEQVVFE
ncbi:MAG: hypothetical protein AB7F75_06370 [Planctomycetota bacterium]